MRTLCTLVCLLYAFGHNAQTFTYGNVFDYSVGDTIVSLSSEIDANGEYGPGTTTYSVYTAKYFKGTNDTIFYEAYVLTVKSPTCAYCGPEIIPSVSKFYVTHLTTSCVNFQIPQQACQQEHSGEGFDLCGRQYYERWLDQGDCVNPVYHRYKFTKGIGMFHRTYSVPDQKGYRNELLKAHKVGENCTVVGPLPVATLTGIEKNRLNQEVSFYPNPSSGIITLSTVAAGKIEITNPMGQLLYSGEAAIGENKLDVSFLAKGIYIATYKNAENSGFNRLVIE